jgi:hypothetical protein
MALWLGLVLMGTAIAGMRGRLPGCEPAPYIIRFTEDRPNPLYRRICYTTAWGEVVAFAVLNTAGLAYAVATGSWRLREFYEYGYFPIAGTVWLLGAFGVLPRVRASTRNEGHERRYFYGSVWAVAIAQPVLWLLWKVVPVSRGGDALKLLVFVGILAAVGYLSRLGFLPARVRSCQASGPSTDHDLGDRRSHRTDAQACPGPVVGRHVHRVPGRDAQAASRQPHPRRGLRRGAGRGGHRTPASVTGASGGGGPRTGQSRRDAA